MLARPNICSTEWISRQYDHEVQGTSVIKPLVGAERDVEQRCRGDPSGAWDPERGLAFAQALLPAYSAIDAYHMVALHHRRGGAPACWPWAADSEHIGGVDNFCWPSIQYHPENNPDGKFKAAQLVRACRALRDICLAYGIPLLSGKDSMYVDGHLAGRYGETHKVSALETLQFSTIRGVPDIDRCVTMDSKMAGRSGLCPGPDPQRTGRVRILRPFRVRGSERSAGAQRRVLPALPGASPRDRSGAGRFRPRDLSRRSGGASGHGGHGRQPGPAA